MGNGTAPYADTTFLPETTSESATCHMVGLLFLSRYGTVSESSARARTALEWNHREGCGGGEPGLEHQPVQLKEKQEETHVEVEVGELRRWGGNSSQTAPQAQRAEQRAVGGHVEHSQGAVQQAVQVLHRTLDHRQTSEPHYPKLAASQQTSLTE